LSQGSDIRWEAAGVNLSHLVSRSLLLTRSDAIFAADPDGRICVWNPGAERIFGYLHAEAIDQSLDPINRDSVASTDKAGGPT
jgi:PAS domain-containing protein